MICACVDLISTSRCQLRVHSITQELLFGLACTVGTPGGARMCHMQRTTLSHCIHPASVSTRRRAVQVMVTGSTNPMQKTSGVGRRRPSLPPIAEKERVCIRESSRSQKSDRIATYACALTSSPCKKPDISTQSHRQHSYTNEESQTTSNLSRSTVQSNHSRMI